ncbi:hypothetical protein GCM10010441_62840 [Kitasatospora paracochleata]|uniref:Uncharacterized protein n=1 Tax=Kitasatospora paracochleata TaxID=58354 RepID=A0ABT1J3V5_9ACTN|nr:DUF6210 family protein [Kitasatospora paracochleata]MCP2311833.1 hypothetical protein [Kitasatospora paracochleata]
MSSRRFVFLDPDGMSAGGWLYVVVEAKTGVFYQQQYGGTACRQGQVEGFLVPLFGPDELDALRELFEKHFRGAGTWNYGWRDDERDRLREIIGALRYWVCDGTTEEPHALQLDEGRIRKTDEAWVPVITPDGPGVLVWFNSD